ncbi:MAG: 16S rRNA (guanine(966)-N(2))-methyltransferase RsmD [Bryobacteraceae bacterium]|nr:16S rRNA (guanine(966)-N(2))-methyltransferase RsmD [Bryobacterales bacterium]MEB2360162.1 16S rRNA (guanine(966)-N(2))-methyltransferase RsmD [Bryobacterales bacterium]NUM99727.1 16S rRNA (guanine(966)-N(2))-methyltransferase RsmD [Bryobacteraceae bacterium]
MRVIGGEFRSRRIKSLAGMGVRPTPDRLRETLFDVLAPRIEGIVFVDAYAGTGSVGIEALSRGAKHVFFIERSRPAAEIIRANLASLGIERRARVIEGKVASRLKSVRGDIVFADPPYHLETEYATLLSILGDAPPSLAIFQHASRLQLKDEYPGLRRQRVIHQGDNSLSFYEPASG